MLSFTMKKPKQPCPPCGTTETYVYRFHVTNTRYYSNTDAASEQCVRVTTMSLQVFLLRLGAAVCVFAVLATLAVWVCGSV